MGTYPIQIIYLNGVSSSGKSTLSKALQEAFEKPFLHVGIDKIIGWMPEHINNWEGGAAPLGFSWKAGVDEEAHPVQELLMGPYAQKINHTFQQVVLTLAKIGHCIIVDDVSTGKKLLDEWKEVLKDFRVLWVGVNAPLTILEQREKERGNRIIGSARGQYGKVHVDAEYDLEVDTHICSLEENVEKIKAAVEGKEAVSRSQIVLETPLLVLRLPHTFDGLKLKHFDERNVTHLSRWRSTTGEQNTDYEARLRQWEQEYVEGRSVRFLIFLKEDSDGEIIGFCNFTQIFRGPFQACYLGYQIDKRFEGRGLMSEALSKALEYMFHERKLHRIMANYMPSNDRSAYLLQKLGFVVEGQAKDYLLINGKWEDHILTSLTNEQWSTD